MSKTKQIVSTIIAISFTILLFLLAMFLPKYINAFLDEKTLNQISHRNISLKTYEISYDSFYEKLYAIAQCDKEPLHVVPVQETVTKTERNKLTEIVQKELNQMTQENILSRKIPLKSSNLSSCETLTLYNSDDKKRLNGITYWKITYRQNKKTILLYLDEEYHKIYMLQITQKENTPSYFSMITPNYSDYYKDNITVDKTHEQVFNQTYEENYMLLGQLMSYYGLENNALISPSLNIDSFYSNILFSNSSTLEIGYQWELQKRDNSTYISRSIGIHLEKMLQF